VALVSYHVLEGLNYLHSVNIVHCGLSLSKLLITETGAIKIANSGLYQTVPSLIKRMDPFRQAPELSSNPTLTKQTDIYDLGICIIDMCNPIGTNQSSLSDSKKISLVLNEFISKCLNKIPDKRGDVSSLLMHQFINNIKRREPYSLFYNILKKFENRTRKLDYIRPEDYDITTLEGIRKLIHDELERYTEEFVDPLKVENMALRKKLEDIKHDNIALKEKLTRRKRDKK